MSVTSRSERLTYSDFLQFPDDGRRHELIDGVHYVTPSTRRRDERIKRRLFDQKGVREYWLVDPKGLCVSICRRADDGSFPIVSNLTTSTDDALTTPLLPGFALLMRDLFEEV